jgi:hypothetical protein
MRLKQHRLSRSLARTATAIVRKISVVLATLGVVSILGAFASTAPASAAGQFTSIQSGFSDELYGTASGFFGGVAFAPNADPWVDFCGFGGSPLDRFENATTTPEHGSNVHPLVAGSPFPSNAGCGLTNNPDGFVYSNTGSGATQINASTAAPTGKVFGEPGNVLGITTDPQTNEIVYVAADCRFTATCTIKSVNPGTGESKTFATLSSTDASFVDGIAFDPTGNFLFLSDRAPVFRLTILNRSGGIVQEVPMSSEPDGISFHASAPKFVVTNNTDGTMTRFDFPGEDFTKSPTQSVFASGGFRGDLTQVGPDSCIYVTQDGTRYDDGTVTRNSSIVRICPGFAPPPGVPTPTEVTTSLSGGGQSGEQITVPEGTAVTDHATLSGEHTAKATGTVEYKVFADNECKVLAASAGTVTVSEGKVPPSNPETLPAGTWYWQATYSGDKSNEGSSSKCGAEIEKVEPSCPATPPKINVRWHYSAEGSAGSWSVTREAKCGQTLTMGPQAMEGALKVSPGKKIKAGYDFTLPSNTKPFTVLVTEGKVVFKVRCVSGKAPSESTFTVTLPNQSYSVKGSEWVPSGNQSSPLVYQGEREVPPLCGTGQLSLAEGGTFSARVTIH